MKILFDHQTFVYQNYGGISRYFTELIYALKNEYQIDVEVQNIYSYNENLAEKQLAKNNHIFKNIKGGWRVPHWFAHINKMFVKQKLLKGIDIFHPTYYDTYYLKYLGNTKFVLTLHDMIHEKYLSDSNSTKTNLQVIENKKILASKASKIIAVSESTKRDIIEMYGIDEAKIEVIYLSNSLLPPVEKYVPTINIPKEYILFVGARAGYKNFSLFLHSITSLLIEKENLHLVCAGGTPFTEEELNQILKSKLNNKIIRVPVDDKILAYLYQNAICFVFPSLYEGFGIPTLEAFACGCPLVLSNTSSMPEVGGDAAVYIDPASELSIYEGVKKVVENKDLQIELIEKGYLQVKKFSWKKCVDEHYNLYVNLNK